jgi:hypothetical protein
VTFQVLTAASMKMTAFWDIAPCRLIEVDKHEIAFEYRYSFGSINTGKLGIN